MLENTNLINNFKKINIETIPQLDLGFESIVTFNGIPWTEFLALSYLIFLIGLVGIIFNFKNFLVTMFSVELMYLGITISFILVSVATSDPKGQIYAMGLLILAAAESAIGLGILIVLFRFGKSIDFESYQELKG
jgi:NADH-quinone oxidoreductase subunit K